LFFVPKTKAAIDAYGITGDANPNERVGRSKRAEDDTETRYIHAAFEGPTMWT
jgi:hypothetical protein